MWQGAAASLPLHGARSAHGGGGGGGCCCSLPACACDAHCTLGGHEQGRPPASPAPPACRGERVAGCPVLRRCCCPPPPRPAPFVPGLPGGSTRCSPWRRASRASPRPRRCDAHEAQRACASPGGSGREPGQDPGAAMRMGTMHLPGACPEPGSQYQRRRACLPAWLPRRSPASLSAASHGGSAAPGGPARLQRCSCCPVPWLGASERIPPTATCQNFLLSMLVAGPPGQGFPLLILVAAPSGKSFLLPMLVAAPSGQKENRCSGIPFIHPFLLPMLTADLWTPPPRSRYPVSAPSLRTQH